MRVRTRLISLIAPVVLLVGTGVTVASCSQPDVCRDINVTWNIHDTPSGWGVSHINLRGHMCYFGGTSTVDSGATSVSWSHQEYGPLQDGFIFHTEISGMTAMQRWADGANGSANWIGSLHAAQCSGAGIVSTCSFGTDFACGLHDDPPTVAGFGYGTCQKSGGHDDFYIDTTNAPVKHKPTMTVEQRIAQLKAQLKAKGAKVNS